MSPKISEEIVDRIRKTRQYQKNGSIAEDFTPPLVCGVDLGTSNIQMIVSDSESEPIAAEFSWDDSVRDGVVVDYSGACEEIRKQKKKLERAIGEDIVLNKAAVGFPPGTEPWVESNVVKDTGFDVIAEVDEPSAAAQTLQIEKGAIVDIGGGTTGISILEDNEVVYSADEATGGHHLTLVIAGSKDIPFEEAEEFKLHSDFAEYLGIVRPVLEKMAGIVHRHLQDFPEIDSVYLVGGTAIPDGFEDIFADELAKKVVKPEDPILTTPLGIALTG
ncbi:MAG: ethanolamine utilization protein EutJ, partial [bacterium]